MLVSPSLATHPHTLSPLARADASATSLTSRCLRPTATSPPPASPTVISRNRSTVPVSSTSSPRPQPRRRSPPSLHKQAALNASLRFMEVENRRRAEEHARQEREAQAEYERRRRQEEEWASENQEVSIIVTSWDDEKRCWYPIEACGPVGRELRMFIERRKAMLAKKQAEAIAT